MIVESFIKRKIGAIVNVAMYEHSPINMTKCRVVRESTQEAYLHEQATEDSEFMFVAEYLEDRTDRYWYEVEEVKDGVELRVDSCRVSGW